MPAMNNLLSPAEKFLADMKASYTGLRDAIAAGQCADWAEYRHMTGKLEGMEMVLSDLERVLVAEDDE